MRPICFKNARNVPNVLRHRHLVKLPSSEVRQIVRKHQKAFKLSIMTQIVHEKRGEINFAFANMDPSSYARSPYFCDTEVGSYLQVRDSMCKTVKTKSEVLSSFSGSHAMTCFASKEKDVRYKNLFLYKNVENEIDKNFKNVLRISSG